MLGAREVGDLLSAHGLDARRSLGQNFVADPNTVRHIVRLAGVGAGDAVIEIGPGLGSLTLALAEVGASVTSLEKDRTLLPVLDEVLAANDVGDVEVVEGDALEVDWVALLGSRRRTLVANLPYNVAVPVVLRVLAEAPMVERLVVMVQREVAERIVATPVGRVIGIPSIKVAWYGSARMLATVPPEVFVPRPRVQSAVIGIDRHAPPSDVVGPAEVFPLVETAYRQRRKMLRSTIGALVDPSAFEAAGIRPTSRPEELAVEDWARLAEASAQGSSR